MSRLIAVVVVALVAAAAIFALKKKPLQPSPSLPLEMAEGTDQPDTRLGGDSIPAVSALEQRAAPASPITPPPALSAAAEAAVLPGIVIVESIDDVTGEPLPGASFHYNLNSKNHLGTTDDAGLARIEVEGGNWVGRIRLVRTDAYAGSAAGSARPKAGEEKRITLVSQAGGTLEGTVALEDGTPVGGAEVRVWNSTSASRPTDVIGLSEADGSFSVPRVGEDFVAAARTESMVCAQGLRGTLRPETECRGLTLVVKPIGIFEGVVVDPDDQPIEGAHVQLSTGLNSRSSRDFTDTPGITIFKRLGGADTPTQITGADGHFYFDNQPEGGIQVRVEATGFVGQWLSKETGDSPTRLTLTRGLTMRGTVTLPSGAPAEGATVRYDPKPRNTKAVAGDRVETGEDGTFALSGLDPGDRTEAHLVVDLEGYAVAALEPPAFDSGQGETNLIQLEKAQALSGTVRTTSGAPADGIRVVLDGGGRFSSHDSFVGRIRSWESEADVHETTTDSDGRFAFQHRRSGPVDLRVFPSGDHTKWIDVAVAASEESVEVVLDPALTRKVVLSGSARDVRTGKPIDSLTFVLWRGSSGTSQLVETVDGAFELTGLTPGDLKLEVRADGYSPLVVVERDFAIGEHPLGAIDLTPAVDASVLIVDTLGTPWTKGGLVVLGADGEKLMFRKSKQSRSSQALLSGRPVLLGDLPDELLTLRVSVDGVSQDFPFEPGKLGGSEIARFVVESPEPAHRVSLQAILLRREALEDPDGFVEGLEKALAGEDQEWAKAHMDEVMAAGPREEVVIVAVPKSGHPAQTTVTWDAATKKYSMKIETVTEASVGSSMSSSHALDLPVPFAPVEVATRSSDVTLKLVKGGTVILERAIVTRNGSKEQIVVLAY